MLICYTQELWHWGIPKQKHGVRRFQNKDGSLTPAGRERYGVGPARKKAGGEQDAETEGRPRTTDSETSASGKKRDISEYSDEELAAVIKRKQQEAMLRDLMAKEEAANKKPEPAPQQTAAKDPMQEKIVKLKQQKELNQLKSEAHPVRSMVKNALSKAASETLGTMAKGAMLYMGKQFVLNTLNDNELADAVGKGSLGNSNQQNDKKENA